MPFGEFGSDRHGLRFDDKADIKTVQSLSDNPDDGD